jgi:FixJ family two-component response regulator
MAIVDARAAQTLPVVLVEDDAALAAALAFSLETVGIRVISYCDAESALAAAQWSIGCWVVDVRLPGMSGLDLLERLRSGGVLAPVLLITSNPTAKTKARASAAGVEIIEKPLLTDALTGRVLHLISARS